MIFPTKSFALFCTIVTCTAQYTYSITPDEISRKAYEAAVFRRQDNGTNGTHPGCPPDFVNVVFNSGYDPSQFELISGAANYITFGLGNNTGQLPMMAYASDVSAAVDLVNSDEAPEYLLTFNEPDYSYAGVTPTMSPEEASQAIQPLLASPGANTKFIAPVTADPGSDWLPEFYGNCSCQDFFHAYNIHVYIPDVPGTQADISAFHEKFSDKPLWVTEIAPGQANPPCSLSWENATDYMNQMYAWGKQVGWIEKIFWNSGNELTNGDTNVCNSYLLDTNNQPTPLMAPYDAINCS